VQSAAAAANRATATFVPPAFAARLLAGILSDTASVIYAGEAQPVISPLLYRRRHL
jgi:hypothetical protein